MNFLFLESITPESTGKLRLLIRKFSRDLAKYSKTNKYRQSPKYATFFASNFEITCPLPKPFSPGAPRKSFDEVGAESKRLKINEIKKVHTPSKIIATSSKLLEQKFPKIAKLYDYMELNDLSPDAIITILSDMKIRKQPNPSESLRFLIKNSLSRRQYESIRKDLKDSNNNYLSPYYLLHAQKMSCLPQSFESTDHGFQVDALDSVCVTVRRLFESDIEYFSKFRNIFVEIKIGIDGARSDAHYSHFFIDKSISDQQFIMATFVILDIKAESCETIFLNRKPCSEKFTRPIFFFI